MKKRAVVLGGGMVGSAMAQDLQSGGEFDVTVADRRPDVLARLAARIGVNTAQADLANPAEVRRVIEPADIVLGALSSVIGLSTMRVVIEAGKSYCDISFMPEDPTVLDGLARERGVTVVFDCGVAPGLCHMMTGFAASQLTKTERVEILVGGLPTERRWPYEYKSGFAPHDVIEEYVRPARLVEGGRVVVRPALSEPELIDFPGLGTLEAFNTDGLRSLITTIDCPEMREKTMRYPGHIALMRVLRETGFFAKEPIRVGGVEVRPLDVTASLLFPKWQYEDGEADLTVMRVVVLGQQDGRSTRYVWDLFDRHDPKTNTRSMSRTTAFPATIMAQLIAGGRFVRPGVHPPEIPAGEPGLLAEVLAGLAHRGVRVDARVERDPAAPQG